MGSLYTYELSVPSLPSYLPSTHVFLCDLNPIYCCKGHGFPIPSSHSLLFGRMREVGGGYLCQIDRIPVL